MNESTAPLDLQTAAWNAAADAAETAAIAPERLAEMARVDVGATPSEVVYSENKLDLLYYPSEAEETYDVPILIVYALINRPYILDLQPDRSVVRALRDAGFDVYLIDWGEPSQLDAHLTLDDYVDRYIDNCVDVVREREGVDAISLLGYCMGGTMSAMYAALYPEKVRNLAMMAAGLDFDGTGGVLEQWGDEGYFAPESVTDAFGNVPAEFLDTGFALMDPVTNYVTKYVRLFENLEDEAYVENFARMQRWLGESIDVAGATFAQFIETIYQGNELARDELTIAGRRVELDEIDMPVLQLVAEHDHLVPPTASLPFDDLIPSEDVSTIESPTGHIGMSVSSKAHDSVWPAAIEWFAERSGGEERDEGGSEIEEVDSGEVDAEEVEEARERGTEAEETGETATESGTTPDAAEAERSVFRADVESLVDESGTGLTDVEGIGDAYAARLRDHGVETITHLAYADVDALATEIEVATTRVRSWVEQARALSKHEE